MSAFLWGDSHCSHSKNVFFSLGVAFFSTKKKFFFWVIAIVFNQNSVVFFSRFFLLLIRMVKCGVGHQQQNPRLPLPSWDTLMASIYCTADLPTTVVLWKRCGWRTTTRAAVYAPWSGAGVWNTGTGSHVSEKARVSWPRPATGRPRRWCRKRSGRRLRYLSILVLLHVRGNRRHFRRYSLVPCYVETFLIKKRSLIKKMILTILHKKNLSRTEINLSGFFMYCRWSASK